MYAKARLIYLALIASFSFILSFHAKFSNYKTYSMSFKTRINSIAKKSSTNQSTLKMSFGGHGQKFRYLPTIRGSNDDHFPRIIPIAGVFPGISAEVLLALPAGSPAPPVGQWSYDFSDPDGPQLGTVALPGSDVITNCIDPVVLITTNTALGVACVEEVEMIVVVDRGDIEIEKGKFYIFQTPQNKLIIQWCDKLENGYIPLGRIALTVIPFTPAMTPKSTGFLEDE